MIEIDGDDDPDGVVIIGESTSDYKNKQPMGYPKDWQKHVKVQSVLNAHGNFFAPNK